MVRYELKPRKFWKNKITKQTASIYGSVPYYTESEKQNWEIVTEGFSVQDNKRNVVFTPYALIGKTDEQSYMEWINKANMEY